ncbi:MAG: hypothetical protein J6I68_03810 [Butyrivibrio sp.]|uniref:hypothetical protein n=1 Tax=Butyrivibrio sp. TaxID=28121 RepID=UPI001B5FE8E8|nr:hypothetical protein [Butyrivibrio sp.]MBP3782353.1 hypothetical protein [Butyrivibrio sp.]
MKNSELKNRTIKKLKNTNTATLVAAIFITLTVVLNYKFGGRVQLTFKDMCFFLITVWGSFIIYYGTQLISLELYHSKRMIFWQEKEMALDYFCGVVNGAFFTAVWSVITMIAGFFVLSDGNRGPFHIVLFGLLLFVSLYKLIVSMKATGKVQYTLEDIYSKSEDDISYHTKWVMIPEEGQDIDSDFDFSSGDMAISQNDYNKLLHKDKDSLDVLRMAKNWCFYVKTDEQGTLEEVLDRAYDLYSGMEDKHLIRILIYVARSVKNKPLIIPDKYRRLEFIMVYMTYESPEFSLSQLNNCLSERTVTDNSVDYTVEQAFGNVDLLFSEIVRESKLDRSFSNGSSWLVDFYNNACVFANPSRSVMALMDYCEMLIKLSSIYCYQACGQNGIDHIDDKFSEIVGSIYNTGKKDNDWSERLSKRIPVPFTIGKAIKEFQKYLYIRYEGDKVSFRGVFSLLQTIRDKVIAHGIMSSESAPYVWAIMIWITMCLNYYLRAGDIRIDQNDGKCLVGYNDSLYEDEAVISDKGFPCFASISTGNGKYMFVNYYNGDKITPKFV